MKGEHTVRVLCASFEVSRSGYYDWCRAAGPRAAATQEFQAEVMRIHAESDGTYGSPRVTHALRRAGRKVGHNRVARVLRECGLQGRAQPAARFAGTGRAQSGVGDGHHLRGDRGRLVVPGRSP